MDPRSWFRWLFPEPSSAPPAREKPALISDWSTELGRGSIDHPRLGALPFDGSRATVDRFVLGEEVEVELKEEGERVQVMRVSPRYMPKRQRRPRQPEVWIGAPSEELRAVAEASAGRKLDGLVKVQAEYYFEWRGVIEDTFSPILKRLPGFLQEHTQGAAFWGTDEHPALDAMYEPHALCVEGVLPRSDWEAWHAALLRETRHLPLQRD